jgi:hypothetical protein
MARIPNLAVLRTLATRPQLDTDIRTYSEPLVFDPVQPLSLLSEGKNTTRINVLRMLRAVYRGTGPAIVLEAPGVLDDAIFALWSQQWPRLRNAFAFRTAVGDFEHSLRRAEFDLVVVSRSRVDTDRAAPQFDDMDEEEWEDVALQDLWIPYSTEFRRFLWRYGSDIRRGRERFSVLAQLFVETRAKYLAGNRLVRALKIVAQAIPDSSDAKTLKADLLNERPDPQSLLPPVDRLGALGFQIKHPEASILPIDQRTVADAIKSMWPIRGPEILTLGEHVALSRSPMGDSLLQTLASFLTTKDFLIATEGYPHLRRELVAISPSLLDSDTIVMEPRAELVRLIEAIPPGSRALHRVIDRLLVLDESTLAGQVYNHYSSATREVIAAAVASPDREIGLSVTNAWLEPFKKDASIYLRLGLGDFAHSTRALARYAALLNDDRAEVIKAGPLPWARALSKAIDDVKGRDRSVFLTFLLWLALASPRKGCEILFERSFETVHRDIAESKLTNDGANFLLDDLPDIGFSQRWDTCLRLRWAVVNAYAEHDLDVASFRRLVALEPRLGDLVKFRKNGGLEKRLPDHSLRPSK